MKDTLTLLLGALLVIAGLFLCRGATAPAPAAVAPAPPPQPIVAAAVTPSAARLVAANDGKVTLEGTVRDEAMRTMLVAGARSIYGDANVIDKLALDGKLGDLGSVVLAGVVGSAQAKEDAGAAARKALGAAIDIDNQLTVSAAQMQGERLKAYLRGKTIEFATGSAILAPTGIKVLTDLLPLVEEEKSTRIEIQGHTDNIGAPEANKQLSQLRALATLRFLADHGVAAARLSAVGYGEERPVADNNTEEGRQRNRRIDFAVVEGK